MRRGGGSPSMLCLLHSSSLKYKTVGAASLCLSPPCLTRNTPCLLTSALQVVFQVTEGSVMAITPPPSLETRLGGLFCQHLPSDLCFKQQRARSHPSPFLVAFCGPARPPSLKMQVGGLFFSHLPSVLHFE